MPHRDPRRPDRVGEAVREEIAGLLAAGVKEPGVTGLVTVTGVEMSRDLGQATVFVSIYGAEADRERTMAGLQRLAAGLRGRVGRALRLRVAPQITFRHDDTVARASRIESLLAGLRPTDAAGDEDRPGGDLPAPGGTEDEH